LPKVKIITFAVVFGADIRNYQHHHCFPKLSFDMALAASSSSGFR